MQRKKKRVCHASKLVDDIRDVSKLSLKQPPFVRKYICRWLAAVDGIENGQRNLIGRVGRGDSGRTIVSKKEPTNQQKSRAKKTVTILKTVDGDSKNIIFRTI
jgi:hypothetical protein